MPPPPVLLSAPVPLGIRMVNEYVYCPRLFYYEVVESVFVHNRDTLEGGEAHKRVDTAKPGKLPAAKADGKTKAKGSGKGPPQTEPGTPTVTAGGSVASVMDPDEDGASAPNPGMAGGSGAATVTDGDSGAAESGDPISANGSGQPVSPLPATAAPDETSDSIHARSVELSSPSLNLTAKLDLVEGLSSSATSGIMVYTPVEYKKGRPREGDDGRELWDADRVQLMLQILLLRENGFPSEEGVVYYRETRQRVTFRPTPGDADWARRMAADAHAARRAPMPPPLDHSPKCPRCSLVGICLPDETRMMSARAEESPGFPHTAASMAQLDLGLGDDGMLMPPAHPPPRNALIDYVLRMPAPGIRRVKVDPDLRRLIAPNPETRALYLNTPGTWVGKSGETVTVKEKDALIGQFLLKDLHHVALFGPVQVSTAVIQALCETEIPLTYFSTGGWFYGITRGHTLKNVLTRIEQFRVAADPVASLALARRMIHGKIVNQRTLLMRNHLEPPREVLHGMKYFAQAALMAIGLPQLLGVEGNAAALYFGALGGMLKPKPALSAPASPSPSSSPGSSPSSVSALPAGAEGPPPETEGEARLTDHHNTTDRTGNAPPLFPFYSDSRNRRPPRDPVNALLSLTYSLLAKECTLACYAVGLDPYVGVLHQPRHGRPALALDIMEEFRPLLADSTVITLINNGMLTERDFVISSHAAGLTPGGRRTVLHAWERRLADPITHPLFGYKVSYRRAIELQTRLLAKSLTGEIAEYIPFMTR